MVELLKNLFVEDESVEELCRLNKILLRLIQNPKGCCEFIKLAGDYKLKKLSWFGMSACSALPDEYIIDLERFAFNTLPNTIKTITLQGCSDVERFLTFFIHCSSKRLI